VPSQAVALLAVLMLRGPQTAAELRVNTERLHRFADISSVEGFLEELAAKAEPMVVRLARAPGSREARWAQLLGGLQPGWTPATAGDVADGAAEPMAAGLAVPGSRIGAASSVAAGELAALKAEQARMAAEIAALKTLVSRLCAELGVDPSAAPTP
jgi:uncharacterized protein YceH (UPF0502 family)